MSVKLPRDNKSLHFHLGEDWLTATLYRLFKSSHFNLVAVKWNTTLHVCWCVCASWVCTHDLTPRITNRLLSPPSPVHRSLSGLIFIEHHIRWELGSCVLPCIITVISVSLCYLFVAGVLIFRSLRNWVLLNICMAMSNVEACYCTLSMC